MSYKIKALFVGLFLLSPICFAVTQENYNDWIMLCKESDVPESEECMIMTESENDRNLSIKKDAEHNLIAVVSQSTDDNVIMSDEAKEFMSMISTKLTFKPNKGTFHTANTKPKLYDDGLVDFVAGHGSIKIDNFIEEMKRSKSIKVNISTAITKDNDIFSLSGFTKAYDAMSEKDKRQSISAKSPVKSNKYENKIGIGSKKEDWEKSHTKTNDNGLYDNKYLITLEEDFVKSIYFEDGLPANLDDAINYAESYTPSDSNFIKEYNLGLNSKKVRVYNSKILKSSLPSHLFSHGNKGDYIIIYRLESGIVKDLTIALGEHP